jgi:hypothetical protein
MFLRGVNCAVDFQAPTACGAIMMYQLWDLDSRNMIDEFETDSEAVAAARDYLTPDDQGVAIAVALVVYDEADQPIRSILGDELAAMVRRPDTGPTRRSA